MERTLYKTVYFVRHGESEGNEKGIHQLSSSPLSEKGREQAGFLATRFETIPIDIVITSPMERARETAVIIGKHTGHEVIESELFQEVRRPSVIIGKDTDDAEVLEIRKERDEHVTDETWRYSDEENFKDLKERAGKALQYILDRPEKNILIVTHGEILRIIISAMAFGDSLTGEIARKFMYVFAASNTGITKIEYSNFGWFILVWNDHAHLGEIK